MNSLTQRFYAVMTVSTAIAIQLLAFSPSAEAKKGFVTPLPRVTTLQRLRKSDTMWKVFEDEDVKAGMKAAMGNAVEKYFDLTQLTEMPEVDGDDLYAAGGVRGLYTVCETFFNVNLQTKKQCIVILDNNKLSVYGAESNEQLPQPVKDYIDDVQSRHAEPHLRVVFEKPSSAPVQIVKALQPKKNINLNSLTGVYARIDSDQKFECANLKVVSLPGNKIKFCCDALNGSHSGEASGVVPVNGRVAEYEDNFGTDYGYKMIMEFDGKYVNIVQKGEGFGGIGVTASGKYIKMDDKAPQIEAE
ncbi:MAG: hypothetical protein K2X81_08865 [Candidatus Obscuribacterales bacterium]|nr:hypothetical protein [Candidatus Obscuribacterales bacterium]